MKRIENIFRIIKDRGVLIKWSWRFGGTKPNQSYNDERAKNQVLRTTKGYRISRKEERDA